MDHITGGTQEWMWLGGLGSRKPSSCKSASSALRNVKYHLQADHSSIHMAGFPALHYSRLRKKESFPLPLAWEKKRMGWRLLPWAPGKPGCLLSHLYCSIETAASLHQKESMKQKQNPGHREQTGGCQGGGGWGRDGV